MGSEDQEREKHRRNEEAEVEGHMHVGGKRLNEEAKEPDDRDDDTPDVEGHMHVGGKR